MSSFSFQNVTEKQSQKIENAFFPSPPSFLIKNQLEVKDTKKKLILGNKFVNTGKKRRQT
jgi:hypothetical protein